MPLSDYTTGNVIGKGTYGEVSLVKHRKDRKQYVIKRVDIHNASEREQKAAEQEAKLLSQVRHPNIVSYKESFQGSDGLLYIVMAFCEGGDMYSKLKAQKGKHLEEGQVVEWFVQIAMALQYLHDHHILHRDLKTQNIFLTKSKIIKVGDLGIARVLENASDMATTLIGTPYYMSPELFSNKPYSYKSDVWALGCCLYEMCTLKHAFNAKDMNSLVYKILKGKLPAMPKIYSSDLCDIIKSMLAQEPEKRPSVSRLLRHSFIKKQIALFLEGTKNRQRKSSKGKEVQESPTIPDIKTEASSKSDSGYNSMNPRKNLHAEAVLPLKEGGPSNEEYPGCRDDQNISPKVRAKPGLNKENRSKNQREKPSSKSRQEANHEQLSDMSEKSSRSRPLPPKPPSRPTGEPNPKPNTNISRERRRFKVSKQTDDKSGMVQTPADSKNSEPRELTPEVSRGRPTSARERRRQRERKSMADQQSVLPSSNHTPSSSSDKVTAAPKSSGSQVGHVPVRSSSFGKDSTDGPSPASVRLPEKDGNSEKDVAEEELIDDHSSGESDLEENGLEEAAQESCHKPRRKESSDVNSLISALDTTLKFTEERRSPDLDSEPSEEVTDNPGDISVSSGRLRDRIDFLRQDCIRGLGEVDFQKACSIIDSQSEEDVELALVELMGRIKFEKYAGKIWQLKFCETFKRS